jgi:hypothetical protein
MRGIADRGLSDDQRKHGRVLAAKREPSANQYAHARHGVFPWKLIRQKFSSQYARVRHGLIPGKANNEETTMRSENQARNCVHGVRDLEYKEQALYAMQEPRRNEHGAEDGGGHRAHSSSSMEARGGTQATRVIGRPSKV